MDLNKEQLYIKEGEKQLYVKDQKIQSKIEKYFWKTLNFIILYFGFVGMLVMFGSDLPYIYAGIGIILVFYRKIFLGLMWIFSSFLEYFF